MNKKPTENTPVGFFTVYQHFSKTEPEFSKGTPEEFESFLLKKGVKVK